ncbi:MAG TPA: DUF1326 domain-containing protein [Bryobacteraceae bacterium]|nr:DUF1326 domain-containing protein [Bryobacteraceae bacterium]
MKRVLWITLALSLVACLSYAAGIPSGKIYGNYVEARTADVYTGPCFANAEVGQVGQLALFGWKITQGAWSGVALDGLGVVGVVRASSTLGDVYHSAYPVKAVLIVDERANPEQRLALQSFAKRMGGDLLQDVVRVEYQPIDLTFANGDMHSMKATLSAGNLAKIQTRAINENDAICHNEEVWYPPLTKVQHAMPAVAVANTFRGQGLGETWSSPDKRSAFVGSFVAPSE